ncbi:MAG: hypothetical protein CO118_10210 [Flavobacteriales bacterium CG_4_9_14_3_um_filter_32_8]|nr:MAG: hypothetical protein CO118_10210 [Flavobacteriales bacterium CG_4_9_14_3_um_filter_32_8]
MKKTLFITAIIVCLFACQSNEQYEPINTTSDIHVVLVEEVIQTSQYTYLQVKDGDTKNWLAVIKMQAAVGETYYHKEGLTMTNFKSKELNRTFDKVLFLDRISTSPGFSENNTDAQLEEPISTGSKILLEKKEIKIAHQKGDITIESLFENKTKYTGKTIQLTGEVVKFSTGIMDKNWIHFQDGTNFAENFDLTVTTTHEVNLGDIITIKGRISLDKDFGYGYFYDVIMEDAEIIK